MISQKAIDLDMSGLMIESHFQPKTALSDSRQQVTPAQLNRIINELIIREANISNKKFKGQLEPLRNVIDDLDEEIIQNLSLRMDIAERIGEYKKANNVTILQITRWEDLINKRLNMGLAMGLSEEFIKSLLQLIHKESIKRQTLVMNIPIEKIAVAETGGAI